MKKINRLLKSQDFKKVVKHKKSYSNQSFILYFLPNNENHIRIGVSVNKKYGKAVERNLAKRQVRMMCDSIFPIELSYDLVLIIRNDYIKKTYEENLNNLSILFQKLSREVK